MLPSIFSRMSGRQAWLTSATAKSTEDAHFLLFQETPHRGTGGSTVSFQPTSDLIFHYFPTRIPHQSPAGLSPISGTYHALHSCASGYCFTFQSSLLSQAYRSQFYSTLRPVLYTLLYDSFLILSKGFDLLLFEFLLNHVHTSSC